MQHKPHRHVLSTAAPSPLPSAAGAGLSSLPALASLHAWYILTTPSCTSLDTGDHA